jgi:crotonobetainyl-CoA:carnitine CoA-transferase CaiB-like acyl-CoA transferase
MSAAWAAVRVKGSYLQALFLRMVQRWQHPLADAVDLVASPIKLSATPVRNDLAPPLLGQHTAEVLRDWLNAPAERCAALQQRGIV